jgi:hypothetical protein
MVRPGNLTDEKTLAVGRRRAWWVGKAEVGAGVKTDGVGDDPS